MISAPSDFLSSMSASKVFMHIKLEFYDSQMNYIDEFTKYLTTDDLGFLSIDKNRPIRRSFSLTFDNSDNIFDFGDDKLVWLDKRMKLYIGLENRNKEVIYIPQGVYLISEPMQQHTPQGKIVTINAIDKMALFTDKRGKFVNNYTIEEGVLITDAIKAIASQGQFGVAETLFNFDELEDKDEDFTYTDADGLIHKRNYARVPYELTFEGTDNRYNALEELAKLANCTIFYDEYGYLRLRKIDINDMMNSSSVWTFYYGDDNERYYAGTVRTLSEESIANHIRVLAGSSETASYFYDLEVNETEPLWEGNPYSVQRIGRYSYFHNNGSPDPVLLTLEDCINRAKYELMNRLGYTERVQLTLSPHFLLDTGDIIEIEDVNSGVTGRYLIESISMPLTPQMMTIEAKKENLVISDWDFI
ncbi:hypothetical protein [Halalkalibacter oceani]|uniref:hypothetical protein n=1 Tax=Halalkalibacter oceani TaxID=1653776 RepID=UPI00339280DD